MVVSPDRGVSTVLDVVTCLLLVTAAAGVHVAGQSGQQEVTGKNEAAAVADVLTTSTVGVDYSVRPESTGEHAPTYPDASDAAYRRSAHGTLGELLAAAAVADTRVDGQRVVPHVEFRERVATATAERLAAIDDRIRVVARWAPYPGSSINGTVAVGPRPPPDADVEAATTSVSVAEQCHEDRLVSRAHQHGFGGLTRLFAECTVETWFPPAETRVALSGRPPFPAIAEHRYRRAAAAVGTDLDGAAAAGDAERANERLIDRLSNRFDTEARERYDRPERAAEASSVDRVEITVRTW